MLESSKAASRDGFAVAPKFSLQDRPDPSSLVKPIEREGYVAGKMMPDVAIYDFDPKLPKKTTPITGKAELEEDGSNLAIVLKRIMENEPAKRKLPIFSKKYCPS